MYMYMYMEPCWVQSCDYHVTFELRGHVAISLGSVTCDNHSDTSSHVTIM